MAYTHSVINQITLPGYAQPFDVNDANAFHFLGETTTPGVATGATAATITINSASVAVAPNDAVIYGTDKKMYFCTGVASSGETPATWIPISPIAAEPPIQTISIDGDSSKVTINTSTHNADITAINADLVAVVTEGDSSSEGYAGRVAQNTLADGVRAATQTAGDNSSKIATTEFVQEAISGITEPMIFEGGASIGSTGAITITEPSAAANIKKGYTYKITAVSDEYTTVTVKVGDTFIAAKNSPKITADWAVGTDWVIIPSGDELNGIQEITVSNGLTATDTNTHASTITTAGSISLNLLSSTAHESASASAVSSVDHIYPVLIDHSNNLAVATAKDTIINTVTDATINNTVVTGFDTASSAAAAPTNAVPNVYSVADGMLTINWLVATPATNAVFQVTPNQNQPSNSEPSEP